ncbi:hypothetical protein D1614_03100 [Maribellus luteus]|uniref:Heavy-metal-associated domain-containing protein n=1 Tax=Maribellus luteus TaxID=2305463 RepID=A0A399T4P5_9BACT|nr:LDCC motif putative metal-binding protein [Maribellus luteus]RIJ49742.1 hypothetical protein D1614_03100 [Maribellus luteus]
MEDYIQNIQLRVDELPDHDLLNACLTSLKKEEGIQNVLFDKQTITVYFNPYRISEEEIISELNTAGIKTSLSEKRIKGFRGWLKNMAAQNKKSFGGHKLDCCDLNQKKHVE